MELKKWARYILPIAVLAVMVFAIQPMLVLAEEGTTTEGTDGDGTTTTVEDEGPALNNASQVLRAERIAEAATTIAEAELTTAENNVTNAQTTYDALVDAIEAAEASLPDLQTARDEAEAALEGVSEDDPEYNNLKDALDAAEAELAAAEALAATDPENTDEYAALQDAINARDEAEANAAGVDVASITAMRESGMGWGEICHELGLDPSINGHGHFKNQFKHTEMNAATARNMKNGLAKGHVNKAGGDNSGVGLGRAAAKKGVGKGASGKGGGNGKSKGKGKGKGQGKGKGKGKSK